MSETDVSVTDPNGSTMVDADRAQLERERDFLLRSLDDLDNPALREGIVKIVTGLLK